MKIDSLILFWCVFFSFSIDSAAQKFHTNSQRALNAYNAGHKQYEFLYFESAEQYLKEAIKFDKRFYEAYALLGEMYYKLRRFSESAFYYREAVNIDSSYNKSVFYILANAELMSGEYENALRHFKTFLQFDNGDEKKRTAAIKGINNCEFAVNAIQKPVPFTPESVGDGINSEHDEYWPSITVDGQMLLFTRQERGEGRPNIRNQEDFYISRLVNNGWSKAFNAGQPLNTPQNEGAQGVTADGTGMYFTACDRLEGMGRCDLYFSSFDGEKWSKGINLGPPVNTRYWEAQPSISSNGKMLFFASNRPGGIGGMDIWYSTIDSAGNWSIPENPGKIINTPDDEMSPYIHFDGKTLYFSSNGHQGMGGFDIFYSKMNDDTTWSEPVNIGYPINTYNDETGLIIDASGTKAYFSSIRDEKKGKDILYFELYEEARPNPVSYFRGRVMDKETGKLLSATYELIDLKSGTIIADGLSGTDGSFLVCLPSGCNYALNVNKKGYLFYSDNFMMEGIHTLTEPFVKDVFLTPLKTGGTVLLSNVFFEFDSWELKPESVIELMKLHKLLTENPGIHIEIGGYTDSIGTAQYNKILSERRAMSVVNFLTAMGISSDRLSYKGYGSSFPVADNASAAGRRQNRRTEVRITRGN